MALTIDFHGPIAFRFSKTWAWAYIPTCLYHTCNVLTDTDDVSPDRHNTYVLTGPKAGQTRLKRKAELIVVDWSDVQGPAPGNQQCYCIYQFPPPDIAIALQAEWVEITKPGGGGWTGDYARGLRFYYSQCPDEPAITNHGLDTTYFQPVQTGNVNYRIEIRFRDTNPIEDDEKPHADAYLCSRTMRALFPPLDQWTVSFEKRIKTVSLVAGPRPIDCGANIVVFNDGITI